MIYTITIETTFTEMQKGERKPGFFQKSQCLKNCFFIYNFETLSSRALLSTKL